MKKVVFSPGDLCFSEADGLNYLRLCFIQNDEATTADGEPRDWRARTINISIMSVPVLPGLPVKVQEQQIMS